MQPLTENTQVPDQHRRDGTSPRAAAGRGAVPRPAGGQGRGGAAGARRRASPWPERSRTTFRSPTRCCAIRDPGDWLMIRRDYRASNYSPLTQITRDNVKDLRLVWSWAMNEGGTSQPAPLVHNGVIYLNNAGNIIQALDAQDGRTDLGKPVRHRAPPRPRCAASRSTTTRSSPRRATRICSRSMREPARRSGKPSSATAQRARTATSSGPLVAKGKVIQGLGACQTLPRRKMLHQRLRRRDRQGGLAVQYRRASTASPAATPGASFRTCSARAPSRGSPAATIPS